MIIIFITDYTRLTLDLHSESEFARHGFGHLTPFYAQNNVGINSFVVLCNLRLAKNMANSNLS